MNSKIGWPLYDKNELSLISKAITRSNYCASEARDVGFTSKFEKKFAKYHKKKYGVACFNCTVGLEALLLCLEIGPGDEVIVPAYTYTSSVTSIIRVGALPIFVDINQNTLCTNLEFIKKKISQKTKAIMLVHFGGYVEDLKKIYKFAKEKKIRIIEDAAQAHGSKRDGIFPGIDAGAVFSFQRNKNMCSGEGGMLITNDFSIANKFRQFIWHGTKPGKSAVHNFVGTNFRITEFQSAILLSQLNKLKKWNFIRMRLCKKIDSLINKFKFIETNIQDKMQVHSRHLYSFRIKKNYSSKLKKKILLNFKNENIFCGDGYKYPVYKSPIFKKRKFPGYFIESNKKNYKKWLKYIDNLKLINSEEVCKNTIILPHFNFLKNKLIYKKINKILNSLPI